MGSSLRTIGTNKGRIGELDDEDNGRGIVYFGTIFQHFSSAWIPLRSLRPINTEDLLKRSEEIGQIIALGAPPVETEMELDVLYEFHYVSLVLQDRWLVAQENPGADFGVFLSHSSRDKAMVRSIGIDLGNHGYRPWLDEWEITAGESIPKRVSEGIQECRVMAVVLSPSSVLSNWVEREWHTKYWEEVENKDVSVIPLLLAECNIPPLLKAKRYADFSKGFAHGMSDLLRALRKIGSAATK